MASKADLFRVFGLSTVLVLLAGWGTGEQQTELAQKYLLSGTALARQGDIAGAISYFSTSIKLESEAGAAYNNRGYAFLKQGEHAKAIADFTTALALNADDGAAYGNRCWVYNDIGLYDKALADCDKALEIDAEDAGAYGSRGYAYSRKGVYDQAIADFSSAIKYKPDYAIAYRGRGIAYSRKCDYARAIEDLRRALQLDPEDAAAYNDLAWLLATTPDPSLRDAKKAVEYAKNASELMGWKEASTLDTLAAAYAEAGRYDQAVKWMEEALTLAAEEQKSAFRSRLAIYRSAKAYRMPKP